MKAAILIRISRNTQEMESQRTELMEYAQKQGYDVPDEYILEEQYTGMDGYDKKKGEYVETDYVRPSISELKRLIENDPELKVVICYELTRLSRNPFTIANLIRWFESHQIILYIHDVEWCTRKYDEKRKCYITDDGVIEKIFAAATYGVSEWKKIIKRTKRGRDHKAELGLYVGHLADGYTWKEEQGKKVIKIDENRIGVIKRIFKLYIDEGYSAKKIAQILNQEKVPTAQQYRYLSEDPAFKGYKAESRTNKGVVVARADMKWVATTISNILNLNWYRGSRNFGANDNGVPNEYEIEGGAIITDAQYEKIKARKIEAFESKSTAKKVYLLSNIFFCGHCGRKMYGHYGGSQNHYYCSSKETGTPCGCKGLSKENVEAIVWEETREYIRGSIAQVSMKYRRPEEATIQFVESILNIGQGERLDFDKEIKSLEAAIKANLETIDEKKGQIEYWEDKEAKPSTSVLEKERLIKYVAKAIGDIKELEAANFQYVVQQKRLRKQKELFSSETKLMKQLDSHDLYTIKPFIESAVKSVTLYNVVKAVKVIRIELVDGKVSESLYTPYLLPHAYIPLRLIRYNPEKKVLTTLHPLRLIQFTDNYIGLFPLNVVGKNLDNNILDGDIDVREFILKYRDYCSRKLTHLEQPSEKQLMYREREKEYQKKYRTGKLKRPHNRIVHDEEYEAIKKERQKLYHRIEKIKKGVRRTAEEKDLEIKVIRERLEEIRLSIKWYNLYQDEPVKPRRHNKTKEA